LIGEEVRAALALRGRPDVREIHILGRGDVAARYQTCLQLFGLQGRIATENTAFRGLHALAKHVGLLA
jgi:2-keto-3-deoxy-galactonokinase